MKFELEVSMRGVSDEDILADLRQCAKSLGKETITCSEYQRLGKASSGTIVRRFGSWNKGLEKAGLKIKIQKDISNDELFENIERIWIQLGRPTKILRGKVSFFKILKRNLR